MGVTELIIHAATGNRSTSAAPMCAAYPTISHRQGVRGSIPVPHHTQRLEKVVASVHLAYLKNRLVFTVLLKPAYGMLTTRTLADDCKVLQRSFERF
jgi:hypothetical protein